MSGAETLSQVWEELAAPSATAFLKALRARGVSANDSEVREFVSSKSERQIAQAGVKFTGKIVAYYENDRWSADLINYTSKPATRNGKKYAHVLFVQDSFSRFIRTAAMTSVSETTGAFEAMLKKAGTPPRQLVSDEGPEFIAGSVWDVCERYNVVHTLKEAQNANGFARMDNAIGQVKKGIRRLQEIKSGDWLTHLEHATSAFNKTPHGNIDAAPNDLPDNVRLNTAA